MSKKEEGKAAKHVQAVAKTAKKASVKKPKETTPSTVRGKIEAIQIKRGAIEEGAAEIQASINKQIDKYKDAIADFNNSILAQSKENKEVIADFHAGVVAQSKENKKAAASIYSGAREIQAGIEPKIKENAEYVKNFYG